MIIQDTLALQKWISNHSKLENEIKNHYHYLHQHPEIGSYLPITTKYVCDSLKKLGYQPIETSEGGIYVTVGNKQGPTLLLRADMDGLPIVEQTNLEFKSLNGNMHACGHDMHTSMMLGVAHLLKEEESKLMGQVKIIFQPHEEGLVGAQKMIDNGILENPHVDAALAIHVEATVDPCGTIRYKEKETTSSSTILEITINGKSSHGSQPHLGIDPLNVAVHIYLAFEHLISRELPASSYNVLTVGMLQAGVSHNIISETATMRCSVRTFNEKERDFILKRTNEICEGIAKSFRATATIKILNSAPCTYNDPQLTNEFVSCSKELFADSLKKREQPLPVSEDFSRFLQKVPGCFFTISTGNKEEGYCYPQHNSKVTFDENALIRGCCFIHNCTINWLNTHSKK